VLRTLFEPGRLPGPPSRLSEDEFVEMFGGVYEHSPWVAREAWRRGLDERHDTVDALAAELASTVDRSNRETRLALIRAHPDLAGRAAVAGGLTGASSREQSGAGLDQCSAEEYERFHSLNSAYKRQFGFPFVMAVKGSDRHAILAAFEERLENDEADEFERAIAEIHKIARFRLAGFVN
jgi:OHCU decarboxylase